jgi:hypothetical protein
MGQWSDGVMEKWRDAFGSHRKQPMMMFIGNARIYIFPFICGVNEQHKPARGKD